MKVKSSALGLALSAAILAVASSALADPTTPAKGKGDVEYVFPDGDKLTADNLGAAGATINVVKFANRQRLLRPRTNFVPELLKSVENM